MDNVGVWTLPTVVRKNPPFWELNAVIARVPLIPTNQSASARLRAALASDCISSSVRRCLNPSLMAAGVIDWSQRRLIGCLAFVYSAIRRKISSPSRPASQALTSVAISLRRISFANSFRRGAVLAMGSKANFGGMTGRWEKVHLPRLTSYSSGALISNR